MRNPLKRHKRARVKQKSRLGKSCTSIHNKANKNNKLTKEIIGTTFELSVPIPLSRIRAYEEYGASALL